MFNINWNVCWFKGLFIHLIQEFSNIQLLVLTERLFNLSKTEAIKEKKKPLIDESRVESQTSHLTHCTHSRIEFRVEYTPYIYLLLFMVKDVVLSFLLL